MAATITMSAGADVSAPPHPTEILRGFEVAPCAWPSAVFLRYDTSDICTGVYIGGRIVLTAAHCLPDRYDTDISCQTDAECHPKQDIFGNDLSLTCDASSNTCRGIDSLVVNDVPDVLFGERYPGSDGHPRRTIPVQYCKQRSLGETLALDFAYCVLSEAPAIQPVPIVMHCEVDQFLIEGTPVVAVGFGREHLFNMPPPYGTKHYLTSELESDASSMFGMIQITEWSGAEPNAMTLKGDSGGPLFAQLPDGTWRVIGIAVNNQDFYEPVWKNVEWMFEDPNVANEQGQIIPCHTPDGHWAPTAACGQFPLSPDLPAGDWTRGPFACNHEASGLSATCGQPFRLGFRPF
ncbi:MAG: trypsin-like serine protease [Nannocystis sp.]|nr:trypsin-like serine protease [Nannocystis sp.]MBA3546309.1 trypsin-like serine protease [Nannocystis sp.]